MHNRCKKSYLVAIFMMAIGIAIFGAAKSARADSFNSYLNPPTVGWIYGYNGHSKYASVPLGILGAGTYNGLIYQGALYSPWIYSTEIVANGEMHEVTVQYSADNGLTWNIPEQGTSYLNVWIRFTFDTPITFTGTDEILFNNDWGDRSRGAILNYVDLPKRIVVINSLQQLAGDGVTLIGESATTTGSMVVFKAIIDLLGTESATVQVELRRIEEPFTGINDGGILQSDAVAPGTQVALVRTTLTDGAYHWRARTLDAQGNASDWQEFGAVGSADFVVDLPLQYKAANLAKQLVNQNYLWGGKGWDVNNRLFVDTDTVKTGYNYWTEAGKVAFDDGLDCSGLVAWSYNNAYAPDKFFDQNYIGEPNANKQYWYNMEATTTSDIGLESGDLLFFDWGTYYKGVGWNGIKDGKIDHVAIYVGGDEDADVVQAVNESLGIKAVPKMIIRKQPGFVAFGRPKNATIAMTIKKHSPMHFSVTDPDGNTISDSTGIATDEEYIRESGDLTYATMGIDANGYPEDAIYSPILKQGTYKINVTPFTNSTADQTYSLDFTAGSTTLILAQNIPLSQIPTEGYGVETSTSGTISAFIPVLIDIKPGSDQNTVNLGSNGAIPVAVFGSKTFDVHLIDSTTIKLADASAKVKGNGQPMVSYSDINNDGFMDIIIQIPTQALQLTSSDVKVNLDGRLIGGTKIKGVDSVRIIP